MVRAEFSGNTILSGNSADYGGGIYASSNASSNSVGTPSSVVIWVTCWGALHVDSNNNMQFIGNTTFSGNSGHYGGTMDIGMNSSTNFSGNINFSGNSGHFGGGINAVNTSVQFNGNTTFNVNSAVYACGGIRIYNSVLRMEGSETLI